MEYLHADNFASRLMNSKQLFNHQTLTEPQSVKFTNWNVELELFSFNRINLSSINIYTFIQNTDRHRLRWFMCNNRWITWTSLSQQTHLLSRPAPTRPLHVRIQARSANNQTSWLSTINSSVITDTSYCWHHNYFALTISSYMHSSWT